MHIGDVEKESKHAFAVGTCSFHSQDSEEAHAERQTDRGRENQKC